MNDYFMRNFLRKIRREPIDEKKRKVLYEVVMRLEDGTEEQKRMFILYYRLNPNSKLLTYLEIQRREGCSYEKVRSSVRKILYKMETINNEKTRKILYNLCKELNRDNESYFDEEAYNSICNFIEKFKTENISEEKRKKLYEIVMKKEDITEIQKRRFFKYYGLEPNNKPLNYSEIARIEQCSSTAVEQSISRVKCKIAHSRGEEKDILMQII